MTEEQPKKVESESQSPAPSPTESTTPPALAPEPVLHETSKDVAEEKSASPDNKSTDQSKALAIRESMPLLYPFSYHHVLPKGWYYICLVGEEII